jgi:alginate O-acetyltransferase complex protein AlgI
VTIASFHFLAFAFAVVVLYNLARPRAWRQGVLFAANMCFLATLSSNPKTFLPLVAFLAFGYIGVRLTQNSWWRSAFVPLLFGTILLFVWLKKYTFLPSSFFLQFPYVTVGLSYILFRVFHLIIDTRDGSIRGTISLINYLNYTLNFTTLVSGPIQWYEEFAAMQLANTRPPLTAVIAGNSIERIIIGFFKMTVLSMIFSSIQHWGLGALSSAQPFVIRVGTGLVIAVAYPIYLYCNFSGYTDIVIGVAGFLRLTLPENFNRPFSSVNFIDFWGRWHITLSNWLKTYVYNPLLKALMARLPSRRVEPFLGVFAFFVTFFLIGVWHGQTSVFVVYGVWLGLGISVNKLYQVLMVRRLGRKGYRTLATGKIYQACARGLTFTWFTFSLFWFWSNWRQMAWMAQSMKSPAIELVWALIFLSATIMLAVHEVIRNWALSFEWNARPLLLSRYVRTAWDTALMTTAVLVLAITNAPAPEVVYKVF